MAGHNANKAITGYWLPNDRGAATVTSAANRDYLFDAFHRCSKLYHLPKSLAYNIVPKNRWDKSSKLTGEKQ